MPIDDSLPRTMDFERALRYIAELRQNAGNIEEILASREDVDLADLECLERMDSTMIALETYLQLATR